MLIFGQIITIIGTYILTAKENSFNGILYDNLMPNVLITAVGIYLLIKNNEINPKLLIIRDFVSKYSYGIYLVHVLVLSTFLRIGISGQLIHPIIGIPITAILCIAVSGFIIFIMKKIPFVKNVVG